METLIAIASKREERELRPDPLPDDVVTKILQAGRVTGSAKNQQPWRFIVVRSEQARQRLASVVTRPSNIEGAPLVIAITLTADARKGDLDAGRAMQNMMLAAWDLGVGTCPNSVKDVESAREILAMSGEETIGVLMTLGYPANPRDVSKRTFDGLVGSVARLPLEDLVREI